MAGQQPGGFDNRQEMVCPDAAYCNAEALHTEPLPPAFRLKSTGHIIYGCALWHRVTERGALQPPAWSLPELIAQVEFLGFLPFTIIEADRLMLDDENLPLDEPDGN